MVGLTEAGYEPISCVFAFPEVLLEQPGRKTLVVTSGMSVVAEERRSVDSVPCENPNIFAVRCALEPKQCHLGINAVAVSLSLLRWVVLIGEQGPIDGSVLDIRRCDVKKALCLRQSWMSQKLNWYRLTSSRLSCARLIDSTAPSTMA